MPKKKRGVMSSGRLMNKIRTKGQVWLGWIAVFFVISVFAGLGIGGYSNMSRNKQQQIDPRTGNSTRDAAALGLAATIGEKGRIEYAKFETYVDNVMQGRADLSPDDKLQVRDQVMDSVLNEQALTEYGRRNGIKVTEADVRSAVSVMKAQFKSSAPGDEPTTILGELQRSLDSGKEAEERYQAWLRGRGWTEQEFYKVTENELFLDKVRTDIKDQMIAMKDEMVETIKQIVLSELADGTEFADLARLFSYDFYSRDNGGEIPSQVRLGFFSNEFDHYVFNLENPGDVTPWFQTEFGWEIVSLTEKEPIEKTKERDEMEEELITLIRTLEGDDAYEPSDEELEWAYEAKHTKLKVRHITLNSQADLDLYVFEDKLVQGLPYDIEHPYVKGQRALGGKPNEQEALSDPPVSVKMHIVAEDFGVFKNRVLIEDRIAEAIELLWDDKWPDEASWFEDEEETEQAIEDDGEESSEGGEAEEREPYSSIIPKIGIFEPGPPRYGEAIEAFESATTHTLFKDNPSLAHYAIAATYEKWLSDEDGVEDLPMSLDEAKDEVESAYRAAIEAYEYEAEYHLALALFLDGRENAEDAEESAKLALQYSGLDKDVLRSLKTLFTSFDSEEELEEVEKKLLEIRARESTRPGSGQSFEITIPSPDADTSGSSVTVEIPPLDGDS